MLWKGEPMSLINREDLLKTLGITDMDCEKCGWTKNTDIHVGLGYKFCPNCGAKMEEGDQDG